jgi:hypothetical protein
MKISSRAFELARSLSLTFAITAGPLVACSSTTHTDGADLDQSAGDLKGGIPANGKDKSDKGKHTGRAGAGGISEGAAGGGGAIASDEDAGVDEGTDEGHAKKPKKPKKDGQHGNAAGASGGSAGEADDDVDESGDESADSDDSADEAGDSERGADNGG